MQGWPNVRRIRPDRRPQARPIGRDRRWPIVGPIGPGRRWTLNRALDLPPGDYRFGAAEDGSWFESDGRVGWAPGRASLASSIMGMDHMVRQMKRDTSATLPEVVRMASLTPAELTGIAKHTGSLEWGKNADVVLLNRKLDVRRVFIGGVEMTL